MITAKETIDRYNYGCGYNAAYVDSVIQRINTILTDPDPQIPGSFRCNEVALTFRFHSANFSGTGDRGDWVEIGQRIATAGWSVRVEYSLNRWELRMSAVPAEPVVTVGPATPPTAPPKSWWEKLIAFIT